jgi:hypothetical protein
MMFGQSETLYRDSPLQRQELCNPARATCESALETFLDYELGHARSHAGSTNQAFQEVTNIRQGGFSLRCLAIGEWTAQACDIA